MFQPSNSRLAMTCAWISAAPSKMFRMRASHKTRLIRIFEREAVAAMDLQGVVGGGPGDARRQQLGHAGLEIAAPAGILLARGEIGELAGDMISAAIIASLSETRGKATIGLPNWLRSLA